MASEIAKSAKKSSPKVVSQEKIISDFNELRQQQRNIASKISELEAECKEHDLVIETLKDVDSARRCYRMVGGVLVERTVGDILPQLTGNRERLGDVVKGLTSQLENKGRELNDFREKYQIRVQGEQNSSKEEEATKSSTQSLLVQGNS